ncbi:Hpt domain-containing protein, partial [Roseofilum casamattae]
MEQDSLNRIMGYFLEEAKDHLSIIEQGLSNLEQTIHDVELVNEIFRAAHSIKGGAAMLGATAVQRTAHSLEDYFKVLKDNPTYATANLQSLLLRVFDGLSELVENLEEDESVREPKDASILKSLAPLLQELEQTLLTSSPAPVSANLADAPTMGWSLLENAEETPLAARALSSISDPEHSAKLLIFQSDIPRQLRELLQGFKQPDTPASRQHLQTLCESLKQAGENFDLWQWADLVTLVQGAIANTDSIYVHLAPVIIKDLKQARDLVLAGTPEKIQSSQDLLNLQQESLVDPASDPELQTLLGIGTEEETDRFETGEAGNISTPSPSISTSIDPPSSSQQYSIPEVGQNELNTLADLFAGEEPNSELTWESDSGMAAIDDTWMIGYPDNEDFSDLSEFLDDRPWEESSLGTINAYAANGVSDRQLPATPDNDGDRKLKEVLKIEENIMSDNSPNPLENNLSELEDSNEFNDFLDLDFESLNEGDLDEEIDLDITDISGQEDLAEIPELELELELPEEEDSLQEIEDLFPVEEENPSEEFDKDLQNLNELFDGLSEVELEDAATLYSEPAIDRGVDETTEEIDDEMDLLDLEFFDDNEREDDVDDINLDLFEENDREDSEVEDALDLAIDEEETESQPIETLESLEVDSLQEIQENIEPEEIEDLSLEMPADGDLESDDELLLAETNTEQLDSDAEEELSLNDLERDSQENPVWSESITSDGENSEKELDAFDLMMVAESDEIDSLSSKSDDVVDDFFTISNDRSEIRDRSKSAESDDFFEDRDNGIAVESPLMKISSSVELETEDVEDLELSLDEEADSELDDLSLDMDEESSDLELSLDEEADSELDDLSLDMDEESSDLELSLDEEADSELDDLSLNMDEESSDLELSLDEEAGAELDDLSLDMDEESSDLELSLDEEADSELDDLSLDMDEESSDLELSLDEEADSELDDLSLDMEEESLDLELSLDEEADSELDDLSLNMDEESSDLELSLDEEAGAELDDLSLDMDEESSDLELS